MSYDVAALRDFYASPLGLVTARLVAARVVELLPDLKGRTVLGLGYAAPYLSAVTAVRAPERVLAFMPGPCGVHAWPIQGRNCAALVEEAALPLPDASVDVVMLAHFLEHTDQLKTVLREVWRILADGGRMIAVVPNRTGAWTYFERTPFGHGRPYSKGQLERLLREHLFTPCRASAGLFLPPLRSAAGLYLQTTLDNIGWRWWRHLGGVVICETEKRLYAMNGVAGEKTRSRRVVVSAATSLERSRTGENK